MHKMQFQRRVLLITFATILLTTACLFLSSKKVYSAQIAVLWREAANENRSSQTTQSKGPESSIDRERFEDISWVLAMTEIGQRTLHMLDSYGVTVRFEPENGSGFYPYRNEIVIDSKFGRFSAALILVHEVVHARYYHEGGAADVTLLDRQTYVQMKMEEEISAVVASIGATSELWEAGVDVSGLRSSLYYPYKQAYASAYRAAKSDFDELHEQTLKNIGRAAGQSVVSDALFTGRVVTSLTQQTYPDYWGSVWDLKHSSL